MSAAAPPPAPASPAKPAVVPTTPPQHPHLGELHDSGTVHKDWVDAERWVATGLVKVTGDVRLGEGKLDGTISLGGKLTATTVHYRGTLDVDGPVEASGAFVGAGALGLGATFHAGSADLKGTARVVGAVTVDGDLKVRGALFAPSVTVGELHLEGEARVPGTLLGTQLSARLHDDSKFGTVKARSVSLRTKPPNLVEKIFFRTLTVTVERVEADSVELEGVDVTFVRAPQITLGRNAHVTEYEGTIVKRHPTSRVGYESKSRPPYGLRR